MGGTHLAGMLGGHSRVHTCHNGDERRNAAPVLHGRRGTTQ
jgi:hypothetical protein